MPDGYGDAEGGSGYGTVGEARSRQRGGQWRVHDLRSSCPRRSEAPVRESGGRGGETLRGACGARRREGVGGAERESERGR
jgi:hypothetical protein